MRRYATVARAENGMDAIDPADRPTAAAGLTFVAGRRHVVEVVTARALHDVAANGRRIPQLRAGSGEQRARQQWVPICDLLVVSCIRVADESPKPQAAVRCLLDPIKGQLVDVDQPHWPLYVLLHQIDEVRAAGDELHSADGGFAHGLGNVSGARIAERSHVPPPDLESTSITASTMLG